MNNHNKDVVVILALIQQKMAKGYRLIMPVKLASVLGIWVTDNDLNRNAFSPVM